MTGRVVLGGENILTIVHEDGSIETLQDIWNNIMRAEVEMKNNDWYERGELPPVGEVVSFHNNDKYKTTELTKTWQEGDTLEVIAHRESETETVAVVWNRRSKNCCGLVLSCLKPIRTERDVLVGKACKDTGAKASHLNVNIECSAAMRGTIDALIDAGWRPIKQMTEEQFIDFTIVETGLLPDEDTARKLYHAGCRFIDTGE